VPTLFLGLDFGTESVRAVLVDQRGRTAGSAVTAYPRGQIVPGSPAAAALFGSLPPAFALQDADDWIESAAAATRRAVTAAGVEASHVAGIGVDFTSCTVLPCRADGAPLSRDPALRRDPHAWPKLWKHHGALEQTARINRVARERNEPWLSRYGGVVGLEWLWPKMLEVIERSPEAAAAAEVWLEAGDWLVWQLVGAPAAGGRVAAEALPRSTCQAGYKGCWSAAEGFPSSEYLAAVHPELAAVRERALPGRYVAPGVAVGGLCGPMAGRLGLRPGTAVSAAIIDAHAGVPGAGVGEAGTLVMVMGTSGCHMLLGREERRVPGVAGVVRDGILPGFAGYETGQAAMGDAFDWVRRLTGQADFAALDSRAAAVPAGAGGVLALDWLNGCRTPLMDGALTGALVGLTLDTGPEQVYRAMLEGSAFGLRWIVDTLRAGGVPVERLVATGGLAVRNPLFVRIAASALGMPVAVHSAAHGSAQGAAILGALAAGRGAGGFGDVYEAVASMAGAASVLPAPMIVYPELDWAPVYERQYVSYRRLAEQMARKGSVMRPCHGSPRSGEP
jgi:L-ribulokinase